MEDCSGITIPEFYTDKTVFITGGSGFIGKVLIEKLLRSCSGLKKIYLLVRPKRGKTSEERIKSITDLPLFDVLKKQNANAIEKLHIVEGDSTQLKLGLTESDRRLLIEETDIIFHGAASVRFDDPLSESIIMNTRGTRELVELALEMKQLAVLVHISTTYCNADRKTIDEQLYPAHADWRKTIELAEKVDKQTFNILTQKYMGPLPNTYTFAKQLAEHVVCDLTNGKVPVVIFRPSIVISTVMDPFPGWIDNFNGPVGLLTAAGKGIVRSVYTNPNIVADYVPVDLVVKALIMSAWKKVVTRNPKEVFEPTFYNGSNNDQRPVTMREIVEMGVPICEQVPLNNILWYPAGSVTQCYYFHFLKVIFYHVLPALFIDGLLKISGHKPMLTKIQRRIYNANMALEFFLSNQWTFLNKNAVELENTLLPTDYEDFGYNKDAVGNFEFFLNAARGGRKFLLKEDDASFEQAVRHSRRMWWIAQIFNVLWYAGILWILFVKIDVVAIGVRKYQEAYVYLTTD